MAIERITHLNGKITYRATVKIAGGASKTMEFASAKEARKWLADHGEKLAEPGQQARRFLIGFLAMLAVATSLFAFAYRYLQSDRLLTQLIAANPNYKENPACAVLFIGNSHTYSHQLPNLVNNMSRQTDTTHDDCPVEMVAEPSYTLYQHWNGDTVQPMLLKGGYGAVVLQEQSWVVLTRYGGQQSREIFQRMVRAIRNNGMRPLVMMTWPHDEGAPLYLSDANANINPPRSGNEMAMQIHDVYDKLGKDLRVDIASVGDYWNYAHQNYPQLVLYDDAYHASVTGAYLAALVMHRALFGSNPETIRYVPQGVSDGDASLLRQVAALPERQVRPRKIKVKPAAP